MFKTCSLAVTQHQEYYIHIKSWDVGTKTYLLVIVDPKNMPHLPALIQVWIIKA